MDAPVLVCDTSRRLGFGLLAAAALLAVVTGLSDPAGRLLSAPAAVAALVLAARERALGPALLADHEHLVVRQGWHRVTVGWGAVEHLRVVQDRRAELVEIDVGSTVLLLTRARLGRYPADVLVDLLALRPGGVSR